MSWRESLMQVLQSASAICAADMGAQHTMVELAGTPHSLCEHCVTQHISLAVVQHALHGLDAAQTRALLARLRDFVAPRIIVIADAQCALSRLDFLALGYETLATDDAEKISLYQFDIATYKQVPDWLNARFWAHPERWKP